MMTIAVPGEVLDSFAEDVRGGAAIPLRPIVFTQGINEKQVGKLGLDVRFLFCALFCDCLRLWVSLCMFLSIFGLGLEWTITGSPATDLLVTRRECLPFFPFAPPPVLVSSWHFYCPFRAPCCV